MSIEASAWIAYLAPLAGVLIILFGGMKLSHKVAGLVSCASVLISFGAAIATLLKWNSLDEPEHGVASVAWTWLTSGTFRIPFEIFIDPLSIWMLMVVTGVGFLIHVYSLGYMAGDPQFRRFM
ncbi:MAG: nuoL, partial [Thermoleophilia bacterium]|nr:nuoL [Thermoleophilia bacterium]